MPPKANKTKKKKKPTANDIQQQQMEEQLQRTKQEMEALKCQLEVRKTMVRRSRKAEEDMQQALLETSLVLEDTKRDNRDAGADMIRQYKTMQSEMGHRIKVLEKELDNTKETLKQTELELSQTIRARDKMARDKDDEIAHLKSLISQMSLAYESVLETALDSFAEKIAKSKTKWDTESNLIHAKNKQILLDFGLNPQDI